MWGLLGSGGLLFTGRRIALIPSPLKISQPSQIGFFGESRLKEQVPICDDLYDGIIRRKLLEEFLVVIVKGEDFLVVTGSPACAIGLSVFEVGSGDQQVDALQEPSDGWFRRTGQCWIRMAGEDHH